MKGEILKWGMTGVEKKVNECMKRKTKESWKRQ